MRHFSKAQILRALGVEILADHPQLLDLRVSVRHVVARRRRELGQSPKGHRFERLPATHCIQRLGQILIGESLTTNRPGRICSHGRPACVSRFMPQESLLSNVPIHLASIWPPERADHQDWGRNLRKDPDGFGV